jgi:chromosome condensin MukBEF complex kleisin-like MukF subunit
MSTSNIGKNNKWTLWGRHHIDLCIGKWISMWRCIHVGIRKEIETFKLRVGNQIEKKKCCHTFDKYVYKLC